MRGNFGIEQRTVGSSLSVTFVSSGLRALVRAAGDKPLDFTISAYVGQTLVTGRPSPAASFYDMGRDQMLRQIWTASTVLGKNDDEAAHTNRYQQQAQQPLERLERARSADLEANAEHDDELTLTDVYVFPAISTQGTRSGGQWLPTARVPFASIDLWWIIDGGEIAGKSGPAGLGVGFVVPL